MQNLTNIRLKAMLILLLLSEFLVVFGASGSELIRFDRTGSPYTISEDLVIKADQKLLIDEGVVIKFAPNIRFAVLGECEIIGSQDLPVILTSSTDNTPENIEQISGNWSGLLLKNAKSSHIRYTIFKNAGDNSITQNSAIYCLNSNLKIEYSSFYGSRYRGISIRGTSAVDAGQGTFKSKGYNKFKNYSSPNFAIVNISDTKISARNNCWGDEDIAKQIYDREDKSSVGEVEFEPIAASCEPQAPQAPLLKSPENNTSGLPRSLFLRWHGVEHSAGYNLLVSEDINFTVPKMDVKNLKDSAYKFMSTQYGTKYYWKVMAVNSIGESNWSDVYSFTIYDTTKPKSPSLLYPRNDSTFYSCDEIKFAWNGQKNIDKYNFELSEDSLFTNSIINNSEIVDTFFTMSDYQKGKNYFWRVRAFNYNGWGQYSQVNKLIIADILSISDSLKNYSLSYISDINNDNKPDFIFNTVNNTIVNNFTSFKEQNYMEIAQNVNYSINADFSNDNLIDIITFASDACTMNIQNINGSFSKINLENYPTPTISKIVDLDGDRDTDIIIAGKKNDSLFLKILYNDYPVFNEQIPDFSAFTEISNIIPIDYDRDGDMDFIISGKNTNGSYFSELFINNYPNYEKNKQFVFSILNTTFINDSINYLVQKEYGFYHKNETREQKLSNSLCSKAYYIDVNNDNSKDIFACFNDTLQIYLFENGEYVLNKIIKIGETISELIFFDSDSDSDIDCYISTSNSTFVLQNSTCNAGTAPSKPQNLRYSYSGEDIILEWDKVFNSPEIHNTNYMIELKNKQGDIIIKNILTNNSSNVVPPNLITANNYYILKELPAGEYSWRLCSINSAWQRSEFTLWDKLYTKGITPLPPDSWMYNKKTGSNSTMIVRHSPLPKLGNEELKSGDAVGIFYLREDELICGGYSVLSGSHNTAITVWGDNPMTDTIKDGFATNENFRFKLWLAGEEKVLPVNAIFSKGDSRYNTDNKYIISEFNYLDSVVINITETQNLLISSDIAPFNPNFNSMLAGSGITVKNQEEVCYPNESKKSKIWEKEKGYWVYSESSDSIKIFGTKIIPETTPISLEKDNWQIIPNYLKEEVSIEDAFENINQHIIAIKDDAGHYYVPSENINNLVYIEPQKAYMIYTDTICKQIYNTATPKYQHPNITEDTRNNSLDYYSHIKPMTGSNMLLVIENDFLETGDEIAVKYKEKLIGSSKVAGNKVAITIWGDFEVDESGKMVTFDLELYKPTHKMLYNFKHQKTVSLLTNRKSGGMVYMKDDIQKVEGEFYSPSSIIENTSAVVYPNPCKDICYINLNEIKENIKEIQIKNIRGNLVYKKEILFSGGIHKLNLKSLLSGVYSISLVSDKHKYEYKIIINK
jgi:hypothetical protein